MVELLGGQVQVLLESLLQSFGRVPAAEGSREVLGTPRIEEPDAALGLELLQVRPPVGRKEVGHPVLAPGAARELGAVGRAEGSAIAFGLLDSSGHVLGLLLGLDDRHCSKPHEEHVVRRPSLGGPFGDREILPPLGPAALCVAKRFRVRLPAGSPELLVDEHPGGGLVEVDVGGGCVGLLEYLLGLLWGGPRRHGLQSRELRLVALPKLLESLLGSGLRGPVV